MRHANFLFRFFLGLTFWLTALAQEQYGDEIYHPQVGQAGKDVIWVPTPMDRVQLMMDLAQIRPDDLVVVLGSGDGRLAIAAAKRGARAQGVEYNNDLVQLSRRIATKEGVSDRVTFLQGDLFNFDFSKATVVMMYLLPAINEKLRPKLERMQPGTRIVSHSFPIGDWRPDRLETTSSGGRVYLWRVKCPTFVDFTDPEGHEHRLFIREFIQNKGSREAALQEVRQRLAASRGQSETQLRKILNAVSCTE